MSLCVSLSSHYDADNSNTKHFDIQPSRAHLQNSHLEDDPEYHCSDINNQSVHKSNVVDTSKNSKVMNDNKI